MFFNFGWAWVGHQLNTTGPSCIHPAAFGLIAATCATNMVYKSTKACAKAHIQLHFILWVVESELNLLAASFRA